MSMRMEDTPGEKNTAKSHSGATNNGRRRESGREKSRGAAPAQAGTMGALLQQALKQKK